MAGYYDKNKDYSKELQRTDLSASERAKLTQERQNKIDDKYGGKEPNMIGSNKTYSQTYGGSSGGSSKGSYKGVEYTREDNGGGVYGMPTSNSEVKNYKRGGVTYQVGADMSRRQDLAGRAQISNGYTVFYDDNGYAYKAVKGVADYTPHQDINAGNGSYGKSGAWTDNEMLSAADKQKIADIRAQMQAGKITGDQANQAANAIRAGYGYTIDKNGYVTDSGALSAVNDRRKQLGLSTSPESAELDYYRYLMGTDTSPTAQASGNVQTLEQFLSNGGLTGGAAIPSQSLVSGGNQAGGISSLEYGAGSDASQYIRDMYAQQQAAQLAALKSAYEQNVLDYQAQDDLISAEAQRQRNQAAAQNELQRMYMNEMGIMQGLNTGTTGQMALAQSAALQGNLANIGTQEQQALAGSALERSKLKAQYSAAVDQAVAQNNYELANALYQEYVRQDNLAQQKAAAAQEQANWEAKMAYQQQQDALAQQNWQAQFDYQKAQDDLNYQLTLQKLYGSSAGNTGSTVRTRTPVKAKSVGYNNGSLTAAQVIQLQQDLNKYLPDGQKIAVDGKWGPATQAAAGGYTADEYARVYYKQNSWSGRSDR